MLCAILIFSSSSNLYTNSCSSTQFNVFHIYFYTKKIHIFLVVAEIFSPSCHFKQLSQKWPMV